MILHVYSVTVPEYFWHLTDLDDTLFEDYVFLYSLTGVNTLYSVFFVGVGGHDSVKC